MHGEWRKKILLIAVPMGGYEQEIIGSLNNRGFKVDFFKEAAKIDRSQLSVFQRIARALKGLKIKALDDYVDNFEAHIYRKYVEQLDGCYDFVFDFGGKARKNCIKILKNKYDCDFVLYLWDDLKHTGTVRETLKYFDRKYIFNDQDSKVNGFSYRSNFFVDAYLYRGEKKEVDLFYKGTARDRDRAIVLEAVSNELSDYRLDLSLFVKGGYIRNFRKVPSVDFFRKWCSHQYFDMSQMAERFKSSRAVLDIAYKDQRGIGLRPIEAMAANCKLITTNKNIINYDFYHKNNIFVLENDCSNKSELQHFLNLPLVPIVDSIKRKYSVHGFVDEIFPPESLARN